MAWSGGSRPELLLVHGAWHGSWCWQAVEPFLTADGWNVSTVDLPSAADNGGLAGMYDDAEVIRERLAAAYGTVAVVAHSYGGVPTSQVAAEAGNVSQLVYLAAHMLEVGESLASSVNRDLPTNGGALPPPPAREALFADLSDEEAAWAEAQLVPQSIRSFTEPLTTAAWKTIPSAFVRCEKDQILPPVLDERAHERAGAVYRLPSSHSPFLSMPKELAAVIGRIVGTAPGDR
jgi:pimeloyl-ACP methyl ester carboxylesterase